VASYASLLSGCSGGPTNNGAASRNQLTFNPSQSLEAGQFGVAAKMRTSHAGDEIPRAALPSAGDDVNGLGQERTGK